MSGFLQWLQQLRYDYVVEMLLIAAASLFCITVHETCHGLVACWLGDDTAKRMKRLTLNPLRHIDAVGLFMMIFARFGWAKPVPVNMRRFKNPRTGMALTALAGPLSNVLLLFVAAILWTLSLFFFLKTQSRILEYTVLFFRYMAVLSAGLAVFNLFPIPPLDGSKILFAFLPPRAYDFLMRYERYGMIVLAVLLFSNVLDAPLLYLRQGLMDTVIYLIEPLYQWLIGLL